MVKTGCTGTICKKTHYYFISQTFSSFYLAMATNPSTASTLTKTLSASSLVSHLHTIIAKYFGFCSNVHMAATYDIPLTTFDEREALQQTAEMVAAENAQIDLAIEALKTIKILNNNFICTHDSNHPSLPHRHWWLAHSEEPSPLASTTDELDDLELLNSVEQVANIPPDTPEFAQLLHNIFGSDSESENIVDNVPGEEIMLRSWTTLYYRQLISTQTTFFFTWLMVLVISHCPHYFSIYSMYASSLVMTHTLGVYKQ